jgi:1-acyl-sn-glycerol-3-phosphate acyltransferase
MWIKGAVSLCFWIFMTVSSFALFPVAVLVWAVTVLLDRRLRLLHLFTCFWASIYTWLSPVWRVHVEGREHIRPGATYVMVANHQSLLDILVLFRLFVHFKWVSKVENFRVPFIGWNMSLNRYIKLKRGDKASVIQMLRAARAALAAGNSIMMFPEGTRSFDGRLRRFKTGAFELAKAAELPLLPIVIDGSANALPKRGFVLRGRHDISVTVLEEISPDRWVGESVDDLTLRVRGIISDALERKHLEEASPGPAMVPGWPRMTGTPSNSTSRSRFSARADGPTASFCVSPR